MKGEKESREREMGGGGAREKVEGKEQIWERGKDESNLFVKI